MTRLMPGIDVSLSRIWLAIFCLGHTAGTLFDGSQRGKHVGFVGSCGISGRFTTAYAGDDIFYPGHGLHGLLHGHFHAKRFVQRDVRHAIGIGR